MSKGKEYAQEAARFRHLVAETRSLRTSRRYRKLAERCEALAESKARPDAIAPVRMAPRKS
jgi:hypothetical protein